MKYLIDESTLLKLAHYLSGRPHEEVAPLLAELMSGLSSVDQQDVINELKEDGTLTKDEKDRH